MIKIKPPVVVSTLPQEALSCLKDFVIFWNMFWLSQVQEHGSHEHSIFPLKISLRLGLFQVQKNARISWKPRDEHRRKGSHRAHGRGQRDKAESRQRDNFRGLCPHADRGCEKVAHRGRRLGSGQPAHGHLAGEKGGHETLSSKRRSSGRLFLRYIHKTALCGEFFS